MFFYQVYENVTNYEELKPYLENLPHEVEVLVTIRNISESMSGMIESDINHEAVEVKPFTRDEFDTFVSSTFDKETMSCDESTRAKLWELSCANQDQTSGVLPCHINKLMKCLTRFKWISLEEKLDKLENVNRDKWIYWEIYDNFLDEIEDERVKDLALFILYSLSIQDPAYSDKEYVSRMPWTSSDKEAISVLLHDLCVKWHLLWFDEDISNDKLIIKVHKFLHRDINCYLDSHNLKKRVVALMSAKMRKPYEQYVNSDYKKFMKLMSKMEFVADSLCDELLEQAKLESNENDLELDEDDKLTKAILMSSLGIYKLEIKQAKRACELFDSALDLAISFHKGKN